ADKFVVAQPGVTGGDPIVPFVIGTLDGQPGIGISGNVIIDGTVAARHLNVSTLSAISADIGTVTAGLIRDSANNYQLDIANGQFRSTDGTFVIDAKNKLIDITF